MNMGYGYDYGQQLDIFSASLPPFKFTKPIKVIELFAGYGSQMLAFEYLKANAQHFKICEWAVPSIEAYNDIHVRDFTDYSANKDVDWLVDWLVERGISLDYNKPITIEQIRRKPEAWIRRVYNNIIATNDMVDITKTKGTDFYLADREDFNVFMSYSFPCQDLSLAGKRQGMDVDSGTRSSMIWQVGRILREMKEMGQLPDCLMLENVTNLVGENNKANFNIWLRVLESLGYMSYLKVLDATSFGIPQTRKRVFVISALGEYSYDFPQGWKLSKCLNDFLEKDVDEKYYLSRATLERILSWQTDRNPVMEAIPREGISRTIIARSQDANNYNMICVKEKPIVLGLIHEKRHVHSQVADGRGTSLTITASDSSHPVNVLVNEGEEIDEEAEDNDGIPFPEATKQGYAIAKDGDGVYITNLKGKRGVVQKGKIQTIKTSLDIGAVKKDEEKRPATFNGYRIRKLTPRECFRLMGVKDEDFDKIKDELPKAWLYHLAGDSIVVDVMMAMFRRMLPNETTKEEEEKWSMKKN